MSEPRPWASAVPPLSRERPREAIDGLQRARGFEVTATGRKIETSGGAHG